MPVPPNPSPPGAVDLDPVDRRSRRARRLTVGSLLPVLLLSVLLAGCGGGDAPSSSVDATRTVESAMGPVQVPRDPQRVVVLDSGELDVALSLGVTPVGYATSDGAVEEVQPYLADGVAGVEQVGTNLEPELERIAALRPDLIIGTKVRVEALYDRLSDIAPTVLAETPADWVVNLRMHGTALGRGPQADQLLQRFRQRARAVGAQLGDPGATTVSIVRFLPGEIRLYTPVSFSGSILKEVGVRLPAIAERETEDIDVPLTLETLDRAESDILFTTTYGDANATDRAQATQLASWRDLPAVRDDRAYPVDDDVWMLGIGPTGANLVLDDLRRFLVRGAAPGS